MELRLKHVYTLRGAIIAPRYFPALKRAAEGHFEGLTVELLKGGISWYDENGQSVDPSSEQGKLLSAWFQGWLNGHLIQTDTDSDHSFADGRF